MLAQKSPLCQLQASPEATSYVETLANVLLSVQSWMLSGSKVNLRIRVCSFYFKMIMLSIDDVLKITVRYQKTNVINPSLVARTPEQHHSSPSALTDLSRQHQTLSGSHH